MYVCMYVCMYIFHSAVTLRCCLQDPIATSAFS